MFYERGFHREYNKGSEFSEAKPHPPPKATPQTTIGEGIIVWGWGRFAIVTLDVRGRVVVSMYMSCLDFTCFALSVVAYQGHGVRALSSCPLRTQKAT